MRPAFTIRANGRDITAAIRDRLLSISVKDEAGLKSDSVTLRLDDRPLRNADGAHAPHCR